LITTQTEREHRLRVRAHDRHVERVDEDEGEDERRDLVDEVAGLRLFHLVVCGTYC
jgi:hypothetical protein